MSKQDTQSDLGNYFSGHVPTELEDRPKSHASIDECFKRVNEVLQHANVKLNGVAERARKEDMLFNNACKEVLEHITYIQEVITSLIKK